METSVTRLLNCAVPIQNAGMAGIVTVELAAAVSAAGGIGTISATLMSAEKLHQQLTDLRAKSAGVVGVNFLIPFLDKAALHVAAHEADLVEFFYGEPDPELVGIAAAHGANVAWQVGSLAEAHAAANAGCAVIIVQGTEAGGHVRGEISLFPLLSAIARHIDVPLIAAGGIASGGDFAAALAAGASGIRVGTRFVVAKESAAHADYVNSILAASAEDTVLTEAFSVMWPNAPHRVLRSAVAAAEQLSDDTAGEITWDDRQIQVPRFSVFAPTVDTRGATEAMALYACESVSSIDRVESAADIIESLLTGAHRRLTNSVVNA